MGTKKYLAQTAMTSITKSKSTKEEAKMTMMGGLLAVDAVKATYLTQLCTPISSKNIRANLQLAQKTTKIPREEVEEDHERREEKLLQLNSQLSGID
jgi:hypothetical protein